MLGSHPGGETTCLATFHCRLDRNLWVAIVMLAFELKPWCKCGR